MNEMKKHRVRKSFWLGPDGYMDIDEKIGAKLHEVLIDVEMKSIIQMWKQLGLRIKKSRYDGFSAYASFSRKPKEKELILSVCFLHPGPDDTVLPAEQIANIKGRVSRIVAILQGQGLQVEDCDQEAEELSEVWVTLSSVEKFEKVLDEVVRLSIEFSLEEYLWANPE